MYLNFCIDVFLIVYKITYLNFCIYVLVFLIVYKITYLNFCIYVLSSSHCIQNNVFEVLYLCFKYFSL